MKNVNDKKDYDFDMIISSEDLEKNRERILLQDSECKCKFIKKYIKKILISLLLMLFGALIGISIYQLFTIEIVKSTPAGNYTCHGRIVRVCHGSNEVSDYLGV